MAHGLDIVVITGLSGSGKSVAIRALEDNGFFCIDNLPVVLIPKFIEICQGYGEGIRRIGLGIDLREGRFFQSWPEVLAGLRTAGHRVEVLFLDAADEVLLRRFSETRRPHPLA
ncbi:MAG: RNase adaptor protein RapZ, partial [Deltaproteobacteria bacterium]|nr:RNase adaptor protein RapZ [Deltaproteobacteria bacterium]